ncbi:hypothetical protein ACFOY2_40365 [Nonomuraea purpurea]|uniref:Uncharacterized protein n=1 Tax=Nonomuraea purpurea TaxID=1849276 RepID=A0ABV8GKU2_9ACTN
MNKTVPAIGKRPKYGNFDEPSGEIYRAPAKGGRGKHVMTPDDQDSVEICVRKRTRIRVRDTRCDDEDSGYVWYYIPLSRKVPAVGKKAATGSFRESMYGETFRADPGGGKGRKIKTEAPDTDTDDPDVALPTPTQTRARQCTTVWVGKVMTQRCS